MLFENEVNFLKYLLTFQVKTQNQCQMMAKALLHKVTVQSTKDIIIITYMIMISLEDWYDITI